MERIAEEESFVQKRRERLDEEIEKEQQRSYTEEDGTAVDLTAWNPAEAAKKPGWSQLEAGFFAQTQGAAAHGMTSDVAPKRAEFIVCPRRNFFAMFPQENRAGGENQVTRDGENTES